MLEMIKKGIFAGLGLTVIAEEKLEKLTQRLVDEGKMSREEAEKTMNEMLESGEKQWKSLEKKIQEFIGAALDDMNLCTKADIAGLEERLAGLEQRVAALESNKGPVTGA